MPHHPHIARRWASKAVAVYSEADRLARHVDLADEAYLIGEGPASASYLRGDKILEIAREKAARARFIRATDFCRRTPISPRVAKTPTSRSSGRPPRKCDVFGPKHSARAIASEQNVPLSAGFGIAGRC